MNQNKPFTQTAKSDLSRDKELIQAVYANPMSIIAPANSKI
jgi:hypothetical protein